MRIILIGNYPPDRQESMERFAIMLLEGFLQAGIATDVWRPLVFFGRGVRSTTTGLGKWLGYLDKWILFPLILRWRLMFIKDKELRFHICDHSNAPYLAHLPAKRTAITCHDVLAIRGAMGHADVYCPASSMGKVLQKWILYHLQKAEKLAAVSAATLAQLETLAHPTRQHSNWQVIYNAFNADFSPLPHEEARTLLDQLGLDPDMPYLLHVGSALPRKNRKLLFHMLKALGDGWQGKVCFAGIAIDQDLRMHMQELGLSDRVVSITKPDHFTLRALYSSCAAFVFPSYSEGFGWPLIEAQASGVPVIASNVAPLPEISGGAALHADPDDAESFAQAFLSLQKDSAKKEQLITAGKDNSKRFEIASMIEAYLRLHAITAKKSAYVIESA